MREYQELDLSRDGAIAEALFREGDAESGRTELPLTASHDADAAHPPNLTPRMLTWYLSHVARVRGGALEEIREIFNAITPARGQRGFLLEAERDRIESEKFRGIKQEREQFFQSALVQRTTADLEEAQRDYDAMKRANGGDEANELSILKYISILFLLALPEIPLNFQSFAKFKFMTPAMAMATVVIVAGTIAISSHIFGITIKQWADRFGPHIDNKAKNRYRRYLALGSVLFTMVFAIITTGRSLLFQEEIARKISLGEMIDFNDYMSFAFTVGGNFLIWAIGVFVAYSAHSRIPDFGAKEEKVNRLKAQLAKLYQRDLHDRIGKRTARAQTELANLERRYVNELRDLPEHIAARRLFEALKRCDSQVLSLFETYRSSLIDKIRGSRLNVSINFEDITAQTRDMGVLKDIKEYERIMLRLPYA